MFSTNLEFNGNAREVMDFYAEVFGYQIIDETDVWLWENGTIAHGEITIYGNRLQFADVESPVTGYDGFSFSINLTNEEELHDRYKKMSVGAEIILPLGKVDWSACYGLLKDKFGIKWQFNLD